MSTRRAAAIMLLVVAGIGLVVGLWPRTTLTTFGNDRSCGSAFAPDTSSAEVSDLAAQMRGEDSALTAGCADVLSSARTLALVLLTVAGVGLLGLALTRQGSVAGDQHRNAAQHQPGQQ